MAPVGTDLIYRSAFKNGSVVEKYYTIIKRDGLAGRLLIGTREVSAPNPNYSLAVSGLSGLLNETVTFTKSGVIYKTSIFDMFRIFESPNAFKEVATVYDPEVFNSASQPALEGSTEDIVRAFISQGHYINPTTRIFTNLDDVISEAKKNDNRLRAKHTNVSANIDLKKVIIAGVLLYVGLKVIGGRNYV